MDTVTQIYLRVYVSNPLMVDTCTRFNSPISCISVHTCIRVIALSVLLSKIIRLAIDGGRTYAS